MLVLLVEPSETGKQEPRKIDSEPTEPLTLEFTSDYGVARFCGDVVLEDRDLVRFRIHDAPEVVQRREFVRVRSPQPVVMAVTGSGTIGSAYAVDVSGGGMLLSGAETLMLDDKIRFRLHLDRRLAADQGPRTRGQGRRWGPARPRVRADLPAGPRAPDPFHLRPPTRGAGSNPRSHRIGADAAMSDETAQSDGRSATSSPPGLPHRQAEKPKEKKAKDKKPAKAKDTKAKSGKDKGKSKGKSKGQEVLRGSECGHQPARARSGSPGQGLGRPRRLCDRRLSVVPRRRATCADRPAGTGGGGDRLHGRVGNRGHRLALSGARRDEGALRATQSRLQCREFRSRAPSVAQRRTVRLHDFRNDRLKPISRLWSRLSNGSRIDHGPHSSHPPAEGEHSAGRRVAADRPD